jgi:transposase-like protein
MPSKYQILQDGEVRFTVDDLAKARYWYRWITRNEPKAKVSIIMADLSAPNPPCIYCSGPSRKQGKTRLGIQKYLCASGCGKVFQIERLRGSLTAPIIAKIRYYLSQGYSNIQIAEKCCISVTAIVRLKQRLKNEPPLKF